MRITIAIRSWVGCAILSLLVYLAGPTFAAVNWTGTGGSSWSAASWSIAGGPGTSDTAAFTDTGASLIPGDVTSVLNANRTIGGLSFSDISTKFHTLDLGGHTLTLGGNLSFNVNTGTNSTATIRNGALIVNSPFANIYAGWAATQSASGSGDLSGLTSLNATIQDLQVGTSTVGTSNGAGTGVLTLSPSNTITASRVLIGASVNSGETRGTLHLGLSNTINAGEFTIARDNSYGQVDIVNGGTLTLGTAAQRTALNVAAQNFGITNFYNGKLDLSAASSFNAYLSSLTVGQKEGVNSGNASGTLLGAAGGTIDIGGAGNTANFYVGRMLSGGSSATGYVDISGMTALNANLNTLSVGTAASGTAQGTLLLAKSNTINATTIIVGSNTGNANSSMRLGLSNTIVANQFTVGVGQTNASVTIAGGGSLNLGSAAQRTGLLVATGIVNNNTPYTSKFDLTGATFNGFLADVIVGEKDGSSTWPVSGSVIGATGGSLDIGAPGNTANIFVGHNLNSTGGANGTADFSALSTLNASINTLGVGVSTGGGPALGVVKLPNNNTIDAHSIIVGSNGNGDNQLRLGRNNAILADQLTVGENAGNGTITVQSGGSTSLGSAARRAGVLIGSGGQGTIDLTGSSFNASIADLLVANVGGSVGSLIGGGGGAVNIGAPGSTARIEIGREVTGGDVQGSVDFGSQTSLTANLSILRVGSGQNGTTQGTLRLADTNTIDATSIVIGSSSSKINHVNLNSLALGRVNTILTNEFIISQDQANSAVTIPSGGSLTLGSPARRANISIATGSNNNDSTFNGSLDLTNAAFVAYLDNVVVGSRSGQTGFANGTFTISSRPENHIEATSITLGGFHSSGTLNYGGGQLYAGSIAAGVGAGTFNWTGGQLSVGVFGTPAIPFNLQNTGSGTLVPGSATAPIGTTTINGNYTQSPLATTAIDIAGVTPGTGNDLVNISGSATLAGTLRMTILNNFAPSVGQNLAIANYASRTGTFAFVAPPHLPADVAFQLDYTSNPNQLAIHMVAPTVQNYTSPAATGLFGTAGNWDTQTTPVTTSSVSIVNAAAASRTVTVGTSTTVHRVSLQGTGGPLRLDIPQGVQLGVANQVVVGPNATLSGGGQVIGDVVVAGGAFAPGAVPAAGATPCIFQVSGNVTAQPASNLFVKIGGTSPGTGYDRLAISGNAALGGNLDVQLVNGFAPAPLQQFDVLTFSARSGVFSSATGMSAGGQLVFAPIYNADRLSLIATLPGDANVDGKVDFADLVAVAQNYGSSSATWAAGDFNYDDAVGFADLVDLAQNYGKDLAIPAEVAGASAQFNDAWAAAQSTVPEPSAIALILLMTPVMWKRPRRG